MDSLGKGVEEECMNSKVWNLRNQGKCYSEKIGELIEYAARWGNCPKKRRILTTICYSAMWFTWRARNDRIFSKRLHNPLAVVDNIVSIVFSWIKHRRKNYSIKWSDWVTKPI